MSWSGSRELRAQLQRLWERGRILASLVDDQPLFPLKLSLKGPSSAELAERFEAVRDWIARLRALPHYRVEMREVNHRVLGRNQVPAAVWVDSLAEAVAILGKSRELRRFETLLSLTRQRQPALTAWLARRPLQALELADDWQRLLTVVDWLRDHPRPGVYLRQVDLPGVHTKFLEAHRAVLAELLDLVLPERAVDPTASGVTGFARRYGFLDRPVRIRFRVLDPAIALLGNGADISLDAVNFARLAPPVSRVFITENEVNFLAFPAQPGSLAIFGAGYGFEELARAAWLRDRELHYWGDIDTHGFAILDQLRGFFPAVASLLMDRQTLLDHRGLWSHEARPQRRALTRLDGVEAALYQTLRDDELGHGVRLEQERIGFKRLEAALASLPPAW